MFPAQNFTTCAKAINIHSTWIILCRMPARMFLINTVIIWSINEWPFNTFTPGFILIRFNPPWPQIVTMTGPRDRCGHCHQRAVGLLLFVVQVVFCSEASASG